MKCDCKSNCDCNPCCCGVAEGEKRKADAQALLAEKRESLVRRAQRALVATVLTRGAATADDVRDIVDLPSGVDPKCFGAVPVPLARAGIIRRDGFISTCRPLAHARPVSVWKLVDREAAIRWLDAHPELPDSGDEDPPAVQSFLFSIQETATPTGSTAGVACNGVQYNAKISF
jgi:hypothetical protein